MIFMENSKESNSYYLDNEIITWLAYQAEKEKRSASWYLNELLRGIRDSKPTTNPKGA